jgi:hypothetical protein
MENAKTYLFSKLSEIVEIVPELRIEYKNDDLTLEHLIKVMPFSEYNSNKLYHKMEEELLFDFISKYPNDSLVFLSENDWINFSNYEKAFEGYSYSFFKIYVKLPEINVISNNLFSISDFKDDLINVSGILEDFNSKIIVNNMPCFDKENIEFTVLNLNSESFSGENNYALAA